MTSNNLIINISKSFIDLISKINKNESQTVYVVDDKNVLKGVVTDGDVRRGLLKGLTSNSPIEDFMFTEFQFLYEDHKNTEKIKFLRKSDIKSIPILNKNGVILKIIEFNIIRNSIPVDAVIMAGGKGTRLMPLTQKIPKPLLKVRDKEIISYNIDRLKLFGIDNLFVTINYLGDILSEFCNNYNCKITLIKEDKFLGTAGSLSLIDEFQNETVLLMNSDLLTNIDYEDFYLKFKETNSDMMVASSPYKVNIPYAVFESDNLKISSLVEKPTYTYYSNAGIYLIKKELIKQIPKSEFFDATDLMDLVISQNKRLCHYPINGYWRDIGSHEDYEKAQIDILNVDFNL